LQQSVAACTFHHCRVADLTPKRRSILGLSNSGRCGRENRCEGFAPQRLALCDERLTGREFLTAILRREDSKRKWPGLLSCHFVA
jgi:hypothetical protein